MTPTKDVTKYEVIGVMSGSSLDGLDIIYTRFSLTSSDCWEYNIQHCTCYNYSPTWIDKLKHATSTSALEYQLLNTEYGRYIGEYVLRFIRENRLDGKVHLIACHGHTVFHLPSQLTTSTLGDGATVAAVTGLPVVSDLRSMDVALGGQGSPIALTAERKLFGNEYQFFLNIGGMACLTYAGKNYSDSFAVDVCPANQLLNLLANREGRAFDRSGEMAKSGKVSTRLLKDLDDFDYYKKSFPKSLGVDFGPEILYPLIQAHDLSTADALQTFTEHICNQVAEVIRLVERTVKDGLPQSSKMLVTGGGARNLFLVDRLTERLKEFRITVVVPNDELVKFKEALVTSVIGVQRLRGEENFIGEVSGASRSSIGGAFWYGKDKIKV
ncbi:anhydro-N-acetylmuramic acid kinase-like [Ornithodoros turicata]